MARGGVRLECDPNQRRLTITRGTDATDSSGLNVQLSDQEIVTDLLATLPKLKAAVEDHENRAPNWLRKSKSGDAVEIYELLPTRDGKGDDMDIVHSVVATIEIECHLNEVLNVLTSHKTDHDLEASMRAIIPKKKVRQGEVLLQPHATTLDGAPIRRTRVTEKSSRGKSVRFDNSSIPEDEEEDMDTERKVLVSVSMTRFKSKRRLDLQGRLRNRHQRLQKLCLATLTHQFIGQQRAVHVIKTLPRSVHDQLAPIEEKMQSRSVLGSGLRGLDHISVGFDIQTRNVHCIGARGAAQSTRIMDTERKVLVSVSMTRFKSKRRLDLQGRLRNRHQRLYKLCLATLTHQFIGQQRAVHVIKTLPRSVHDQLAPIEEKMQSRSVLGSGLRGLDHISVGFDIQTRNVHCIGARGAAQSTRIIAHGYASVTPPEQFGQQQQRTMTSYSPSELANYRSSHVNAEAKHVIELLTTSLIQFERVIRRRRLGLQTFMKLKPGDRGGDRQNFQHSLRAFSTHSVAAQPVAIAGEFQASVGSESAQYVSIPAVSIQEHSRHPIDPEPTQSVPISIQEYEGHSANAKSTQLLPAWHLKGKRADSESTQ
ncbi:hypothetical protein DVH05_001444 [Phytophthora capsici]|nr:hypothetical protein DVH05_001440 [Phytophthora capsici]KAG1706294.1 hypothetical protein DVH05_001442 [Phytophthora capsici]KAG1706296.1 hypothetical protein DVH05_001444 [Phytophthora capsici]